MNICLKWISNEQNDINILDLDIVVGERESVCVCVCVGGGGGADYGVVSTFWLFRNNSIIFKLQFRIFNYNRFERLFRQNMRGGWWKSKVTVVFITAVKPNGISKYGTCAK